MAAATRKTNVSDALIVRVKKEIDDGVLDFERKSKKQEQNKSSMVKRNAAEKDLLKSSEKLRDFLMDSVKGDKQLLAEVFGGDCARFWRIKSIMDATELLPDNEKDQRWKHLHEAMNIIEEVLKTLGNWKPYKGMAAPEFVTYRDVTKSRQNDPKFFEAEGRERVVSQSPEIPKSLVPGQAYGFACVATGCTAESLNFSISPALPSGLVLDEHTGEISGFLPPGLVIKETTYTVTAENKAGKVQAQLTFAVKKLPPTDLSYGLKEKTPSVGEKVMWKPTLQGGEGESYEIDKPLPAGLTLDPQTGIISGTPSHHTPDLVEYTITCKNDAGVCKASFVLAVLDAPPTKVEYPDMPKGDLALGQNCYLIPEVTIGNPQKGGKRMTMAVGAMGTGGPGGDQPQWGRSFASTGMSVGTKWGKLRAANYERMMLEGFLPDLKFEVSPPLPTGLHLAHNTGIITGRPMEELKRTVYKITCKNDSGQCSVDICLGVQQKAPARLAYTEVPEVIYTGNPLTISPEVENVPTKWSVGPALPEGLTLCPDMGVITGNPQEAVEKQVYTVTASNKAGKCNAQITLTVRNVAPRSFIYPEAHTEYPVGKHMELIPRVEGSVTEFTLEGTLPKGLTFDPKTGRISGTPEEKTETRTFNLQAKNESGAVKTMLAFEIKAMPPTDLHYPRIDHVYHLGENVDCSPTLQGHATTWSIEPALPPGMQFNIETGAITGCPNHEAKETSYTVIAKNEAGGASTVIDFAVVLSPPEGLAYPMGEHLIAGKPCNLEPELQGVVQDGEVEYFVAPPLPPGLKLNKKTGVIDGTPENPSDGNTKFKITAKTSGGETNCDLEIMIDAPVVVNNRRSHRASVVGIIDQEFASKLEECTDLSQLPQNPGMVMKENWMIWMVHRCWLNDPTLDVLDFSCMEMPLPHVEPRIAPKLMKALAFNTNLKKLLLADSNLRAPQAQGLAEALRQNKTLKELNVESNWLDSEAMKTIANGLKTESCNLGQLAVVRMAHQVGLTSVGRPIEQAAAEMMRENQVITKFGFVCEDPHWNDVISKMLIRNADVARRKRKGLGDGSSDTGSKKAVERTLEKVEILAPPDAAAWEIFEDDDKNLRVVRQFMFEKMSVPTNQQVQAYAAGKEQHIPFGKIGPLMKTFQTKLMDACKGKALSLTDAKAATDECTMVAWSEKNQRWCLEVHKGGTSFFKYLSAKQIDIQISEAVAEWIQPH